MAAIAIKGLSAKPHEYPHFRDEEKSVKEFASVPTAVKWQKEDGNASQRSSGAHAPAYSAVLLLVMLLVLKPASPTRL